VPSPRRLRPLSHSDGAQVSEGLEMLGFAFVTPDEPAVVHQPRQARLNDPPMPACSFAGRRRGRPRRERVGATESSSGNSNCASGVFAPEIRTLSGIPRRSHSTWIFEPGLPRSTGFGPVRSPFSGPGR
jgi:hypothetical protein